MSKFFEVEMSTRVTVLVELGDDGTPAAAAAEATNRLVADVWSWEAEETIELTDDSLTRARAHADIVVSLS